MFHMLTSCDLKPGVTIDAFRHSLAEFTAHLLAADLVHATGPVGRRQRHDIMDTDSERNHEYYFIMSFRDLAQCDRAVEYIFRHEEPAESIHNALTDNVQDPIFTCWEDI